MKTFIIINKILLITALNLFAQSSNLAHLDSALHYVGITELTGNNDGPEVEMFQKSVGLHKGNSWCAAFVYYCISVNDVIYPKVKSGLARHYKTKRSIKAKHVLQGTSTAYKGMIGGYEKGNTIFGHLLLVTDDWNGKYGKTIEGNTSSGTSGSQSNGDGVYLRNRGIYPGNYFRITWFTPVEYDYSYLGPILLKPKPLTTIESFKKIIILLKFSQ